MKRYGNRRSIERRRGGLNGDGKEQQSLEYRNEVSDSFLLVLRNALRDPGDVSDFLQPMSAAL